jgi:hypothetical protein
MDQFDLETDTGKVENTFDISKLSRDKKNIEKLSFCQTQDA